MTWLFLVAAFRKQLPPRVPSLTNSEISEHTNEENSDPSTLKIVVISGTALLTITVWVFFDLVEPRVGNIGLVGVFPIAVYGSCGYLTKVNIYIERIAFNRFICACLG